MKILLRLAYDGTDFHGYAAQRDRPDGTAIRTVQGEVERVLGELYKTPVATRAASRTDAGVHAHGQLLSFAPPLHIPIPGLLRGVGGKLPSDVAAVAAWEAPDDVDVRGGNEGKYYRYRISCTDVSDPTRSRYAWRLGRRLDPYAMREAASRLVGTHDFGSFRAAACQSATTTRTIEAVEITFGPAALGPMNDPGRLDASVRTGEREAGPATAWGPDWIEVHVWGTAFLMNMVRIIVGTLVDVGAARRLPTTIDTLLQTQDRSKAGMTAPAQGLTLVEVRWPPAP